MKEFIHGLVASAALMVASFVLLGPKLNDPLHWRWEAIGCGMIFALLAIATKDNK